MRATAVVIGLGVLLGAAARASADSVTVALTDASLATLSRADCSDSSQTGLTFSWARVLASGDRERVFVSASDTCTTSSEELETLVADRTRTAQQASYTSTSDPVTAARLFALVTGNDACPAGVSTSVYLCVVITPSGDSAVYGSARIALDSTPPSPPTIDSVDIYDSGLGVNWTAPSGTVGLYRVYYGTGGVPGAHVDVSASSTETKLEGLVNGVEYTIAMTAFDDTGSSSRGTDGNESLASATQVATPRASQDFLERYLAMNGTETGGCASTGPGAGLLLLLAGAVILRRRRQAAVVAIALGMATLARADTNAVRSPEGFDLQLRLGAFLPAIDSQAGLSGTPYADIFGSDTRYLGSLELAWPLMHGAWGTLSAAASTGYWQATGSGRYPDAGDVASADAVTLRLVPFSAALRYRADLLYERWHLPLVPYAQAGYGVVYWHTGTDVGTSKASSGSASAKGEGWGRGLEWAAGLHLVLNGFDAARALELKEDSGIVSTSIFLEYRQVGWSGIGGLRLDGGSWAGGFGMSF